MVRGVRNRHIKRTAYIFCEGKTEQFYFEGFKKDSSNKFSIKIILSEDKTPDKMVLFAKEYLKRRSYNKASDLVFLIFDRDNNSNEVLSKANLLVKEENFRLIFSNPSFEFWFLCHFVEINQSFANSNEVIKKLQNYIKWYSKTDLEIYEKTRDKLSLAIKTYKKITKKYLTKNTKLIT